MCAEITPDADVLGVRARAFEPENNTGRSHKANGAENPTEHGRTPNQGKRDNRFPLIPFNDLKPSPKRSYLVKGILPRVGLGAVWGPPKCGKSFWLFDIWLHLALRWSYRGRRVQGGTVVYCAFEGAEGYRARAEAFRRKHGLSDEDVPLFLMPIRMDLVRDHQAFIAAIRSQLGPDVPVAVALDTLNRSLAGSESSDEDMSAYVNAADAIREAFDCLVAIIHHCGVDGSRPRGHTSLTGAIETQIAVKRDSRDNIVATVEYMKDGPEGEVITSRLETIHVGTDEDGDPITSCVITEAGNGDPAAATREPSGQEKIALVQLRNALIEAGEHPPASNHIPGWVKSCVPLSLWREYCYMALGTSENVPEEREKEQERKKKAFQRAQKNLQENNRIGVWGKLVWVQDKPPEEQAGHGGT